MTLKQSLVFTSIVLALTATAFKCVTLPGACADKKVLKESGAVRTLHFSPKYSAGILYKYSGDEPMLPTSNHMLFDKNQIGEAKGTVTVPADKPIYLMASYDLVHHPEILDNLKPDDLACVSLLKLGLIEPINSVTAPISRLTGLKRLELNFSEFTDEDMIKFDKLVNLEGLAIEFSSIKGTCFKKLSMPKLKSLDLDKNPLQPGTAGDIAKYTELRLLNLGHCGITDSDIPRLYPLTKLNNLNLSGSTITAKGLEDISHFKELTNLDLSSAPNLKPDDFAYLKSPKLDNLYPPKRIYTKRDMAKLRKYFPKASFSGLVKLDPDKETKSLFAPLH